jgi:hypothetical protein
MCCLTVEHATWKDFPDTNKKSIRSVGSHNIQVKGSSQQERWFRELSPSMLFTMASTMLFTMLNVPRFVPCRAADCAAFSSGKRDGGCYWTINLDGKLIDSPEVIYLLPLE